MVCGVTVWGKVGEALVLAPLSLAIADVEVDLHWAGYPLVPVGGDLHHQRGLQHTATAQNGYTYSTNPPDAL